MPGSPIAIPFTKYWSAIVVLPEPALPASMTASPRMNPPLSIASKSAIPVRTLFDIDISVVVIVNSSNPDPHQIAPDRPLNVGVSLSIQGEDRSASYAPLLHDPCLDQVLQVSFHGLLFLAHANRNPVDRVYEARIPTEEDEQLGLQIRAEEILQEGLPETTGFHALLPPSTRTASLKPP